MNRALHLWRCSAEAHGLPYELASRIYRKLAAGFLQDWQGSHRRAELLRALRGFGLVGLSAANIEQQLDPLGLFDWSVVQQYLSLGRIGTTGDNSDKHTAAAQGAPTICDVQAAAGWACIVYKISLFFHDLDDPEQFGLDWVKAQHRIWQVPYCASHLHSREPVGLPACRLTVCWHSCCPSVS